MTEIRHEKYSPSITICESNHLADVREYLIETFDTEWHDDDGWCESPELLGYDTPWKFVFDEEEGRFHFELLD